MQCWEEIMVIEKGRPDMARGHVLFWVPKKRKRTYVRNKQRLAGEAGE
jgi:hypothetical protein